MLGLKACTTAAWHTKPPPLFFKVLGQLTETGVVSPEQFMKSFEHMKKSGDYYVTVVEDVTLGQIVATATLIIEHKFIHSCAKRGRVEDVVVSDKCRRKQLGKLLLSTLTLLSKKLSYYKITLDCLPQNAGFYKKLAYTVTEENYMCWGFQQENPFKTGSCQRSCCYQDSFFLETMVLLELSDLLKY